MMEFEAGPSGKGWHTHWEGEQLVLVINRPEQARLSLMPHGPKVQLVVQLPPELTAILAAHESAVAVDVSARWAAAVNDGWVDLRTLRQIVPYVGRPACGERGCTTRADLVDPSGVGWCAVHEECSLHGPHPFVLVDSVAEFERIRVGLQPGLVAPIPEEDAAAWDVDADLDRPHLATDGAP